MSDKKQAEPVDMSSAALVGQAEVETIINTHCVGCHSSKPTDAIFTIAPAGVMLNDYASMLRWMPAIKARVVDSHNMPLMNKTNMTQQERDTLGLWIAQSNR
jgi:uncharacterized membrane protein